MDFRSSKVMDAVQSLLSKKQSSPGVRVNGILPDSPAERAGIKSGDILIAVNDIPLMSMQDYIDACADHGKFQVFDILRDNNLIQITINYS